MLRWNAIVDLSLWQLEQGLLLTPQGGVRV